MIVFPIYKVHIRLFFISVTTKLRAKITKIIQNRAIDNEDKIKTFHPSLHKNLENVEFQKNGILQVF